MNSINIIRHETLRLIFNKKFFYMILVLGLYTLDILLRLVTLGSYGTAPFSEWSYSSFLTMVSPILTVILILLCTSVFSEKEIRARKIICSTPITQVKYYTIKTLSISLVFIAVALIPIIMSCLYYGIFFKYYTYSSFIKPILLFLIPSSILALGGCMFIGRLNLKLLYVMIPFAYLNGLNFRFPVWLDLYGNNFLLDCTFLLWENNSSGIVPYSIPPNFIISRIIFVFAGILFFVIASKKSDII